MRWKGVAERLSCFIHIKNSTLVFWLLVKLYIYNTFHSVDDHLPTDREQFLQKISLSNGFKIKVTGVGSL